MVDRTKLVPALYIDEGLESRVVTGHAQHRLRQVLQTRVQARKDAPLWTGQAISFLEGAVALSKADVLTLKPHKDEQQILNDYSLLRLQGQLMEGPRLYGLWRRRGERG